MRRLPDEGTLHESSLVIEVQRLAQVVEFGLDTSKFRGSGVDFLQSRPYVAGDPVESIDWRVTARTQRVHVKEYESLRATPVYIVVDRSASMCFGSGPRHKYAWAVRLAGAFALASLARLSPVGLLALGKRGIWSPPSLRALEVRRWLHELRTYPLDDDRSLRASLERIEKTAKAPGLLLVFSDLHDPPATQLLKRLAHRHETLVFQMHDPAERGETAGLLRAKEAETDRTFLGWSGTPWIDPSLVKDALRNAPLEHVLLDVGQPIVPRVLAFLKSRARSPFRR